VNDDTILGNGNYATKYNFFKNLLTENKIYDYIVFVDDDLRHILQCNELKKEFPNFIVLDTIELVD
jgi:transketolase C-terminal domain/subunit